MSFGPPVFTVSHAEHERRLTRNCILKTNRVVPSLLVYGFPMTDPDGATHLVGATEHGLASRRITVNDASKAFSEAPPNYKSVLMSAMVLVPKTPLEHIEECLISRKDEIGPYFREYAERVSNAQVEPVSLLIKSGAGVGKTSTVKIWMDLLAEQGLAVERTSPDADFYDNLVAVEAGAVKTVSLVFMDEMFVKPEHSDRDLKALMRIYNPDGTLKVTNPNKIKGRANVQIIVMTTNNVPALGSFNVEAINRRVDFKAELRTDGRFGVEGRQGLFDMFEMFRMVGSKFEGKVRKYAGVSQRLAQILAEF
jgi:hypothetical protein